MKRLLLAVSVSLALANFAAAEIVTGTYDIDTIDGSSTTLGGSSADAYNLTSTGFSTFSLLTFTPDPSAVFSFAEMDNLSLDYNAVAGGIAGGSARLKVKFTNGDSLLALLGPAGSFIDPTLGAGSSGNLLALDDTGRYDLSQGGLGGSGYTNYDAALAAAGGLDASPASPGTSRRRMGRRGQLPGI